MTSIFAISDLHLSFGVPNKSMEVFGLKWKDWTNKISSSWKEKIKDEDLVLIGGDISWAKSVDEVMPDLEWIHALPGVKVLIKGNHDYWWTSLSKLEKILPPSLHLIQNNAFHWKGIGIAGSRLWDSTEYNFEGIFIDNDFEAPNQMKKEMTEKIYQRELQRLELSLQCLKPDTKFRIAMTHYPPISANLTPSKASALLEKYQIQYCIFGHLHNVRLNTPLFGEKNGILYRLTSCDYLNFLPLKIHTI